MFEKLAALGVPLAVDDVLERFGLSRPRPDQELLRAKAEKPKTEKPKDGGEDPSALANELASELGVPAGWLAPIEKLIAEMEAKLAQGGLTEDEARTFLAETQRRLPELLGGIDEVALAGIFEGVLGSAVVAGVRDSLKQQNTNS